MPALTTRAAPALLAACFLLSSCGGGGGGGGGGTAGPDGPDPEPVLDLREPRATVTVSAALRVDVAGLTGPVELTDGAGRSTLLVVDGTTLLRSYNAGDLPGLRVSSQPGDLDCRLDVAANWAMPPHDEVVSLRCDRALADDGGVYTPRQLVTLIPALDIVPPATVTGILDTGRTLTLRTDQGAILFAVPNDLANGDYRLDFSLGGRDFTYDFTVVAAEPIADGQAYIEAYRQDLRDELAALRLTLTAAGQLQLDEQAADAENAFTQLLALSAPDMLEVAYWLQANDPFANLREARSTVDVAACGLAIGKHLASKFSFVNALGGFIVGGTVGEILFATGTTVTVAGVKLPAAIVLGVASAAVVGVTAAAFSSNLDAVLDRCFNDQVQIASDLVAGRSLRQPRNSGGAGSEPADRLRLLDNDTRTVTLTLRREMTPLARNLVRSTQDALLPVSGLLPEGLVDFLYTIEFVVITPFDDNSLAIADFSSSGIGIDNLLAQATDGKADFTFTFTGEAPTRPQPFTFVLAGKVNDLPTSVPVRGTLSGDVPLSYSSQETTAVDTVLAGAFLRADYAERFVLLSEPAHGTLVLVDEESGEFSYTPEDGFSGDDSFTFRATNVGGESEIATVTLRVGEYCVRSGSLAGDFQETCSYSARNGTITVFRQRINGGQQRTLGFLFEPDILDPAAPPPIPFHEVQLATSSEEGVSFTSRREFAMRTFSSGSGPLRLDFLPANASLEGTEEISVIDGDTVINRSLSRAAPDGAGGARRLTVGFSSSPLGTDVLGSWSYATDTSWEASGAFGLAPGAAPSQQQVLAVSPLDIGLHFNAPLSELARVMQLAGR